MQLAESQSRSNGGETIFFLLSLSKSNQSHHSYVFDRKYYLTFFNCQFSLYFKLAELKNYKCLLHFIFSPYPCLSRFTHLSRIEIEKLSDASKLKILKHCDKR